MFPEREPVSPDQGQIKGAVALNGNSSIFLSGPSIAFSDWALTAFYGGGVGRRPLSKGVFVVKWLQMEGVEGVFEGDGRWYCSERGLVLFRWACCCSASS